jgi:hypothetical protein
VTVITSEPISETPIEQKAAKGAKKANTFSTEGNEEK